MNTQRWFGVVLVLLGMLALYPPVAAANETAAVETAKDAPRLMVYYFHGNRRCKTCKSIESQTREVLQTGFKDELKSKRIEFQSVNLDESDNEHYVKDFQLVSRTVVLARYQGKTRKEFRVLDKTWQLVRDKPRFGEYIRDNVKQMLKDAP